MHDIGASKKKTLGAICSGTGMPNAIQSREYSKDSGNDGMSHKIWAVNANWDSNYGNWNVNANSVTNPNRWNEGNQVFSRNCLLSAALPGCCFLSPATQHFSDDGEFS